MFVLCVYCTGLALFAAASEQRIHPCRDIQFSCFCLREAAAGGGIVDNGIVSV